MDRAEAEELLRTLFADPEARTSRAEAELVPDPDPAVASIGHQVVGIVLRDLGETDAALHELRTALRLARRSGDEERWADVLATLGGSLACAGRVREGLRTWTGPRRRSAACPSGACWCVGPGCWATCWPASRRAPPTCGEARRLFAGPATRCGRRAPSTWRGCARRRARRPRGPRPRRSRRSASSPASLGDDCDRGHRPCTTWAGWPTSAATCRSALERVRRRQRALRRARASPASTWSLTGATPTWPRASRDDALAVVEQALVARPLLAARARRTCWSPSPRRPSRPGTGRARCRARRRGVAGCCGAQSRARPPAAGGPPRDHRAGRAGLPAGAAAAPRGATRRPRPARRRSPSSRRPCCWGRAWPRAVRSPRAAALADAWLEEAADFRSSTARRCAGPGLARPGAAPRRSPATPAGCCGRATSGSGRSTSTRPPSAARSSAPSSSGHGAELAELGTRTALASG